MVFTVESLEGAIEKAKVNIKIFEDAINGERLHIKEYRDMIDKLEEKDRLKKEMTTHIEVAEDAN